MHHIVITRFSVNDASVSDNNYVWALYRKFIHGVIRYFGSVNFYRFQVICIQKMIETSVGYLRVKADVEHFPVWVAHRLQPLWNR